MQTQQLIKASAEVVTITHFARGDVYKRVDTDYSGTSVLRFGVITDAMNNGEDAALTALEFRPEYQGVVAEQKVWNGSQPAALFAAEPEEVAHHVGELKERAQQKVREAEVALDNARDALGRVLDLERFVTAGELSAPATVRGELAEAPEAEAPAE